MLKQRHEQIQFIVRTIDVLVAFLAFGLAYFLRAHPEFFPSLLNLTTEPIGPLQESAWMCLLSVGIHFFLFPFFGFYQSLRLKTIADIVGMVLKAGVIEFFILGSFVFLLKEKETSRLLFGLFIFLNYAFLLVQKLGLRIFLSTIRKRGYNYRQVLIVGTSGSAGRIISELKKHRHWGYVPFGVLSEPDKKEVPDAIDEVPVIGTLHQIESVVKSRAVDECFFILDDLKTEEIAPAVMFCETLGIPARLSFGAFHLAQSKFTFMSLGGLPIVTYYTTLMTPIEAFLKRAMDISVSLLGLLITTILYPWIAFMIKKDSEGPVIFKQIRIGENGRRFKCYKFRTMFLAADQKKKELLSQNQMDGPIFKLENDPRITQFGKFLRRTSLDELPQFLNILRGDMSVVGTRPPTPDEVEKYQDFYRRRLSIRPGLTGLWQVRGRNRIHKFEDVLALDLQYIDHWSIWLDLRIIFKTIWVTIFRKGAY